MRETVDMLASAIHDAKNQLFFAGNAIAAMSAAEGASDASVSIVREAIDLAGERLTNALLAYRLSRGDMCPSISAVTVGDLIEDVQSIHRAHFAERGVALDIDCAVDRIWPLDRDLVIDILNNALQNALRHAASRVLLSVRTDDDWLMLAVEDDGPGFAPSPAANDESGTGVGLYIGRSIARLHVRHGRHGELSTANGGRLGGAVIELRLP